MGLKPELPPYPTDRRLTDTQLLSQSITAPVGRAIGGPLPGQLQNARFGLSRSSAVLGTTIAGIQPSQPLLFKALLPGADVTIGARELFAYLTIGMTSRQHQNHLRSLNQLCRQRPASCTAFQLRPLRRSCSVGASTTRPKFIYITIISMLYKSRTYCTRDGRGYTIQGLTCRHRTNGLVCPDGAL